MSQGENNNKMKGRMYLFFIVGLGIGAAIGIVVNIIGAAGKFSA